MKKQLLTIASVFAMSYAAQAQVLITQNYESFTIGNLGTDLTGTTPGQGDIYTLQQNGTDNTIMQIVSDANKGKVLQFRNPASSFQAMQTYLFIDDLWDDRTTGNNVVSVDQWIYSGPATTSATYLRTFLIDGEFDIIGGIQINNATKAITGMIYGDLNNTGTPGLYSITLGDTNFIAAPNTWYKIRHSFDGTTGTNYWSIDGTNVNVSRAYAPLTGLIPAALNTLTLGATTNAGAFNNLIDGYSVRATTLANLSVGKEASINEVNLNIFPNPTTDVLNIEMKDGIIESVAIIDITGKLVKTFNTNTNSNATSVNVKDLASGNYVINIATTEGVSTKKFIKK